MPIISALRRIRSARVFCATWEGIKEKKKTKRKEVQPLLKAGSFAQCGKEHAGTRNSLCKGAAAGKSMLGIRHLSFRLLLCPPGLQEVLGRPPRFSHLFLQQQSGLAGEEGDVGSGSAGSLPRWVEVWDYVSKVVASSSWRPERTSGLVLTHSCSSGPAPGKAGPEAVFKAQRRGSVGKLT